MTTKSYENVTKDTDVRSIVYQLGRFKYSDRLQVVEDLTKFTRKQISLTPGIGEAKMKIIDDVMERLGLSYADKEPGIIEPDFVIDYVTNGLYKIDNCLLKNNPTAYRQGSYIHSRQLADILNKYNVYIPTYGFRNFVRIVGEVETYAQIQG